MAITKKKGKNQKIKKQFKRKIKQTNKITKQIKSVTTYNSPCLHRRWRCYQVIALNDRQVGLTSVMLTVRRQQEGGRWISTCSAGL